MFSRKHQTVSGQSSRSFFSALFGPRASDGASGAASGTVPGAASRTGARAVQSLSNAVTPVLEGLENRCLLAVTPLISAQEVWEILRSDPQPNAHTVRPRAVRAPAAEESGRPSIAATRPANGETGFNPDGFIAADVNLPNVGAGIDASTINNASVRLIRVSDGRIVNANVNTSGGGDALALTPDSQLDPNTQYRFEVTDKLKDLSGAAFVPYSITFTTGAIQAGSDRFPFQKEAQENAQGQPFTALTIGPDGKLYAGTLLGEIFRFKINADGSLGAGESIATLQNHEGGPRLLSGFEFDPKSTAQNPILWVSHNQFAFENAQEFTGKISRLSGANLGQIKDVVVGLPRSILNHVTNQLHFGPDGALYVQQGSNSAMGAPDNAWGRRVERMLNAAILRIDTEAISGTLNVKTSDGGGTYNPFAKDAPVTLYATGIRNAYDLVWHSNGHLYVPTNGSAANGATPATPGNLGNVPRRIDQDAKGPYNGGAVPGIGRVTATQPDFLFDVKRGGYYGHPNPSRGEYVLNGGNPTSGKDENEVVQYPVGTQPDRNYRGDAYNFGTNQSPNGVIEYKNGNAFGGDLKGKLLVVRYSGGDDIAILTPRADGSIDSKEITGSAGTTHFHDPLDLVEDTRNGNVYVAEFGAQQITLLRPVKDGGKISTDRKAMYFNDPQGGSAGPGRSITITNTGTQPLGIPAGGFRILGTNAKAFSILNTPDTPLLLGVGESITLNLNFSASNLGIKTATLRIESNDVNTPELDIPLRGLGTKGTGGLNEPSLQRLLDLYELGIRVGDSNPDDTLLNNPPATPNDEVPLPRLVRAGAGRVTIEPLAVFGVDSSPAVKFGWYTPGSPDALNQVLTVDKINAQTVMPPINGSTRFDPGSNPFGLYTIWPGFGNRGVYSEDALNTWEPDAAARHKVRFYPLKDKDGEVVPNAYVVAYEEFLKSSTDFQDFVFIIRNVKPAATSPEIGVQNLDGAPFPDRVIFNTIRDKDPRVPNGVHDTATVRVFNSGSQPLNVTDIELSGPWRIDSGPGGSVNIPGGGSVDIKLKFIASAGDIHTGSLVLHSNDPDEPETTIQLAGFWQAKSEGGFGSEPDLFEMIEIFGYGTTIEGPGQKLSNGGRIQRVGDEILSSYWRAADSSSPVTVRQLAAFHTQGAAAALFWHAKGSNTTTRIINHAGVDGQSFLPRTQGDLSQPAFGSFLSSGVFGFKIDTEWSDPTKNPKPAENPADEGHHVRFWPARDRDGIVIPDTYIMSMDYSGINYDYNDNVYVVSNIRPEVDQPKIPTASIGDANGGRITIRWTDPNNGESGYRIERGNTEDGPFTQIGSVGANVTSFNDDTVQAGKTYFYRVRAVSDGGDSPYSNVVAVSATDGPRNLALNPIKSGGIRLSWQDLSFEVAYKVERSLSAAGPWTQVGTTGPSQASFRDETVTPGVVYFYRVRATKPDGGDTGYSDVKNLTAPQIDEPGSTLVAPENVKATAAGSNRIDVTWANNNTSETGYVIERSRNAESGFSQAGTVGADVTSFKDSGLAAGVKYYYRVRAKDAGGTGPVSAVASATTSKPSTPITLAGQDVGGPKRGGKTVATTKRPGYDLSGGGRDVSGTTDQFHFASTTRKGNFDLKVRLAVLSNTNPWTKAGIMVRDGVKANARNVFAFATPGSNGYHFSYRSATSGNTTVKGAGSVSYPNTWLRLKRVGNVFTAYRSTDGRQWTALGSVKFKMPPSIKLGLAVTSHNAKKLATAKFRDLGNV